MFQKPSTRNSVIIAVVLSTLCVLLCFGCGRADQRLEDIRGRKSETGQPHSPDLVRVHLPLGNPSNASADPRERTNYLVVHESFVASYNDDRGSSNWVAWKVTASDLGEPLPRPDFRPDESLPDNFRRVVSSDYSGSGFDRGHMAPSADRFADLRLNEETFLMTNIVPQSKSLNQFPWQKLESHTRTLVRKGYDVYAVAGTLGEKSQIRRKVSVPNACWKILYIVPRGSDPVVSSNISRIVAVEMPNDDGISGVRWITYKTSVRSLEQKLGFNFFSALPQSEQDRLESTIE